jgi:hypothetical protein
MMFLLALAAAAATPTSGEFIADDLLRVQVFGDKELPKERDVGPRRPFFVQQVTQDGYLEFADREEEKAARRKYDMDMSDPFALTEWVGISAKDGGFQHRGWLYCVRRSRFGIEKCFRDSDADGKFDALTNSGLDTPTRLLSFQDIPPIPYRYVPRVQKPYESGMYRRPEVSLFYDVAGGSLRFGAYAYTGLSSTADLGTLAMVDTTSLPTTVELAGARIRVITWDGKRARLAVETPMSTSALRFIAPDNRPLFGGGRLNWKLEFVDSPLPGR